MGLIIGKEVVYIWFWVFCFIVYSVWERYYFLYIIEGNLNFLYMYLCVFKVSVIYKKIRKKYFKRLLECDDVESFLIYL